MVYHSAPPQRLDATFAALADPTRRGLLARLALGEHTIGSLAEHFDMSLPALSKHVYVLADAGLATVERTGRVRRVRLNPAPMRQAAEWMDHYRRFWESELELLALYLEDPSNTESTWQSSTPRQRPASSKSGARSARRSSASSTRGRKRKS